MIDLIFILGLGFIALILSAKNDVLIQQNKHLQDIIKRDKKWHDIEKKYAVEMAKIDERLKINMEKFQEKIKRLP